MNFGTMAKSDAVTTIMLSKIQSAKNFHSIQCSRAPHFFFQLHIRYRMLDRKCQFQVKKNKDFNQNLLFQFTLDYLISVEDVIIMQAGNFPKIDKHAECSKAMQVGIFKKSIVKKSS